MYGDNWGLGQGRSEDGRERGATDDTAGQPPEEFKEASRDATGSLPSSSSEHENLLYGGGFRQQPDFQGYLHVPSATELPSAVINLQTSTISTLYGYPNVAARFMFPAAALEMTQPSWYTVDQQQPHQRQQQQPMYTAPGSDLWPQSSSSPSQGPHVFVRNFGGGLMTAPGALPVDSLQAVAQQMLDFPIQGGVHHPQEFASLPQQPVMITRTNVFNREPPQVGAPSPDSNATVAAVSSTDSRRGPARSDEEEPAALSSSAFSHASSREASTGRISLAECAPAVESTAGEEPVASKPKRPLSAYNLFFRDERAKLLSGESEGSKKREAKKSATRKVGFAAMAQAIASKWRQIDPETRAKYQELASEEMGRYRIAKEIFVRSQQAILAESRAQMESTVDDATRREYLAHFEYKESRSRKSKKKRPS